jgi:3-isopropylmalate/(R)-2-methylmalate dehydratase large subunit
MPGMHALHKILANCARPQRPRVEPGEFLEVEPDVFGVIVGVNGAEAKRMAADLAEVGITDLPLKDRIYAVADHASPDVNGKLGQRGAYNNAVEFAGPVIESLSMDMRFTFANMGTEMGAVTSYIQPDAKTLEWVDTRATASYTVYNTDRDFEYAPYTKWTFRISSRRSRCRTRRTTSNRRARSKGGTSIRPTSARVRAAASKTSPKRPACLKAAKCIDVRLIVTPGSREVLKAATALGYVQTLHEANAIVTRANCGACPGLHGGILAPGDVAITSITRNFEGRMGPGGEIYLASAATVAASAIAGRIASPLQYA